LYASLAAAGEPLTFGIDPAELDGLLGGMGLRLQSDLGAADYRRLAYGEAARAMQGHEFYRVAHASIEPVEQELLDR
jgi:hypothetical protein